MATIRLTCYGREGSPKPERNPTILISVATNQGGEKCFVVDENKDDRQILQAFVDYIKRFNPDVLVGYGVNELDWPYL
ncbi:hypothetical protein KEJ15_02705, partial [Candidatus Bathyarchaeota archaeon]|nr:hypothetical protein [Candidatus Bathyarchaeota archaeon]